MENVWAVLFSAPLFGTYILVEYTRIVQPTKFSSLTLSEKPYVLYINVLGEKIPIIQKYFYFSVWRDT